MDSGNSGSLQSSSGGGDAGVGGGGGGGGGDEVYDSNPQSLFLNPPTQFNHMPIFQQPPPPQSSSSSSAHHHHQQPPSTFFDPTSFSQPLNPNTNPMYNLDSLWSRNPNPMYNNNNNNNLDSQQDPYLNPTPVDKPEPGVTPKNPKKRTRASRRAPTTVLTTDTTNFRQMVQEFTGIPAAPFSTSSASSPFTRRLDLYGGGIVPLRPSAQKIPPTYLNSTTATTSNFQLPPSENHLFTKQPLNLSNLQNQMFQFQSIAQTRVPQQGGVNVIEGENQRSEAPNAFVSSSSSLKRWRGQDENLMNLEGGSGNIQNGVVSSRSDGGDQLPGNEDPWICPSD